MKKRMLSAVIAAVLVLLPLCAIAAQFSADPVAIEQAAKSVLMLEVYNARGKLISTGSGFVAFDNSTLVTNYHVIEDGASMIANTDDRDQYDVTGVLVVDPEKDIAICKFAKPTDLAPLDLHTEEDLMRAQSVVAIGNPMSDLVNAVNTVSIGNISALYSDETVRWVQFTAPISEGSSGGALFDDQGRVIGMTSAYLEDAQNMNLAIHISEIAELYANAPARAVAFDQYRSARVSQNPPMSAVPSEDNPPALHALFYGDRGEDVRRMQQALIDLGYLQGTADGVFGKKTEKAVADFNADIGLSDSYCASIRMQLALFASVATANANPNAVLRITEDSMIDTVLSADGDLYVCVEVTNFGKDKTVRSFDLYAYGEDAQGNDLHDNCVYYTTTYRIIAPGRTGYCDYIALPRGREIHTVYFGIGRVTFTDGTSYDVPDEDVEYWFREFED